MQCRSQSVGKILRRILKEEARKEFKELETRKMKAKL